MIKKKANTKQKIVIIGGGGAGLFVGATALGLNKENFEVYLISDEDLLCRCSIPYVFSKKAKLKDSIMPDSFITRFGIKLIKGRAIDVDLNNKFVRYSNHTNNSNGAKLDFDKLVIATGARPFIPPLEGVGLDNVFSIRSVDDLKKINNKISKVKNILVVGGGVIGTEVSAAMREVGKKVTLSYLENDLFERVTDLDFSNLIEDNLKKNKVELLNNSILKKIVGNKKVEKVQIEKEGKLLEKKFDLVLLATGVRANKEIAEKIGIKTNKFGILVDDYFRTSNKDVYAVGDVAVAKNMVTGKKEPSQLATNGVIQGKIAGKNILGMKEKYIGHTSAMIFQFLGDEFGQVGLNPKKAKEEGIDFIEGVSHSTDIYKDLSGVHNVLVKILFNKKNGRVIGATAYGRNLVWVINLISFAISKKSTIEDLMKFDYASHPSLSPWPFMDPIVDASENAYFKLMNNKKYI